MSRPALLLPAMLLITGCATVNPLDLLVQARQGVNRIGGAVLDTAAAQIDGYCVVPLEDRLKLRNELNTRTQKGNIVITCEGDPVPPAPAPIVAPASAPSRPATRPAQPAR